MAGEMNEDESGRNLGAGVQSEREELRKRSRLR